MRISNETDRAKAAFSHHCSLHGCAEVLNKYDFMQGPHECCICLRVMEDYFSILVFNNSPSRFSTNLANEINLSGGDLEMPVRHIMYPTHVATTGSDE